MTSAHTATVAPVPARNVVFHRHFDQFSGGHLKVWDYFNHLRSSAAYEPWVRFSATSRWDDTNPWYACADRVLGPRQRVKADVLLLAGLDWQHLPPRWRRRPPCPVVNLIQHVRHGSPADVRYDFLAHPAVRICVSEEVTEAIAATGRVNGPIFTVPNAVDVGLATDAGAVARRDVDVLVVANKRPEMGTGLAQRLRRPGRRVELVDRPVPRPELLDRLRRARVTLFLPHATEGFYLPALEGMALGTVVVCPDCVGNRSFCRPGVNCLRPDHHDEKLVDDVEAVLAWPPERIAAVVAGAAATARRHDMASERSAFLAIIERIDQLQPR